MSIFGNALWLNDKLSGFLSTGSISGPVSTLTLSNIGSANSTVSGATLATGAFTSAIGDLLFLMVAADNAGVAGVSSTSAAITDATGNTWTQQFQLNRTLGVSGDGLTLTVWSCAVTIAHVATTVTINFSPNTTAKACLIKRVTGGAASIISVGVGITGVGANPQSIGVTVLAPSQVVLGFAGMAESTYSTFDSDVTKGTWSAGTQAVASLGGNTSKTVATQHKPITATGIQSWDLTKPVSPPYCMNTIIIQ